MASTDARYIPIYGRAYRLSFALRDASGDLVTSWSGQDSNVSKDGGNYAACTNEATEIQTSGTGYLDLTSTEMTADTVITTIAATGAKTLVFVLNPEKTMITGTVNDANTSPSTTVFAAEDITEATADHFIGRTVIWLTGNLARQSAPITDYALDTGEGKFTVKAMTEAPADGDVFLVV
jgi:hypothetical protein